jgi:hypothetical protein
MPSKVITEEPHQPLRRITRLLLIGVGVFVAFELFNGYANATHRAQTYDPSTPEFGCQVPKPAAPALDGTNVSAAVQISCDQNPTALTLTVTLQHRAKDGDPWKDAAPPKTDTTPPGATPAFVYVHAPCTPGTSQWQVVYTLAGTGKTGARFAYPETAGDTKTVVSGECQ